MTEVVTRRFRYVRLSIGLLVAAAAGFVLIYVFPFVVFAFLVFIHPSKVIELQRVESPDRSLDSAVMQIQPGFSIESDTYRVYVALSGSKRLGNPVLEGEGLQNLKTTWLAPRLLQISYSGGCIGVFHDHWPETKAQNGSNYVEVRLKPLGANSSSCD